MKGIVFDAWDYTADDTFIKANYRYTGSRDEGWNVTRNGAFHLSLGPGYLPLRIEACGICGTDLSRRYLPFPLPQVIGHEVSAADPSTGARYTVEINDSCAARGDAAPEVFCREGIPTHCPERRVLGIDRLPGGFGPWILAPVNAMVPAGELSPAEATLVEPLAAALHAVRNSQPRRGDRVAVLGTGRLGLLITACLASGPGAEIELTAFGRNDAGLAHARSLGAHRTVVAGRRPAEGDRRAYDLVFDATGSPDGFALALALARREVHLKSTHGRECLGIRHLTEMVVDEIAILPFSERGLSFMWEGDSRRNDCLFVHEGAAGIAAPPGIQSVGGSPLEGLSRAEGFTARLPRFDLAVVSDTAGLDAVLRPDPSREISLVRPRGAVLLSGGDSGNPLDNFIAGGGTVRTSRCGSHRDVMKLLAADPALPGRLAEALIVRAFPARDLSSAFRVAREPGALKIVVEQGV